MTRQQRLSPFPIKAVPNSSLNGSPRGVPLYKNGKLARF